MEAFQITKIIGSNREIISDIVASEVPLTILINNKELATLLCSPLDLEDLTRGFLFTVGLVKGVEDIKSILINKVYWQANVILFNGNNFRDLVFKRIYTSGCGRGVIFYNAFDITQTKKIESDLEVSAKKIKGLMKDLRKRSKIYFKTGGVHCAALADGNNIIVFREDIGRHNAIDKVIGYYLLGDGATSNKIILTSGRVSSEVILKIKKCQIPIIVSFSAPTDQAVKLARDFKITLIGFARGRRMSIYSQAQRVNILLEEDSSSV